MCTQGKQLDRLYVAALNIAVETHEGQLDKGGNPYIEHPMAVAASLESTEHKIVALLHDVIEDGTLTEEDLEDLGFTESIIRSVGILTKNDSMDYEEYLSHIKSDSNALYVKIADIKHNMDISRIPEPTEDDYARLEKYRKALLFLEE